MNDLTPKFVGISTLPFSTGPYSIIFDISVESGPSFSEVEIGQGVMIQGFYWLCPEGDWWNTVNSHMVEFSQVGFDAIWLPAPSKAASTTGISGMGYEPYDYYDLGTYDQKGNVRTRFGTEAELRQLTADAHTYNIGLVADIVVNHNNGGKEEFNPYIGGLTYTDFTDIASGLFPRDSASFHPCPYGESDEGVFASFPDLCHANPYVHDGLIDWGQWLMNDVGFDGWRFDNVVNFDPLFVRDWMTDVGGWGVAEFWDGNRENIQDYIESTENTVSGFDFGLIYRLEDMCDGYGDYNIGDLRYDNGLLGILPEKTVTFVMNHDTERDEYARVDYNRHLAYAYILTQPAYPSVFWLDYFDMFYHNHITNLITIRNQLATGSVSILYYDNDVFIFQNDGAPGLITAINDDPLESKTRTIITQWDATLLYDLAQRTGDVTTDDSGEVTFTIPPNDYVILSPLNIRDSLDFAPFVTDHSNPLTRPEIDHGYIQIGEGFNGNWGLPIYYDPYDDTRGRPEDLSYLYLRNDDARFHFGLPYTKNTWTSEGNIEFGIALDTKAGGTNWGLSSHSLLNYAGDNLPEYILQCTTDVDSDPSNIFQSVELFRFSSDTTEWEFVRNLTKDEFASSADYRFLEFSLPFDDLEIYGDSDISVMVYSTQENKTGAADSIPHSSETVDFGDGETWLVLPDPISFTIAPPYAPTTTETSTTDPTETTDSSDTSSDPSDNGETIPSFNNVIFILSCFIGIIFLMSTHRQK